MNKTFHDAAITIRLPAPPVDVDLSNDGSKVAVALAASPGTPSVCVYDTATGDQVTSLAESSNFGRGVVFGRGGRCLYALVQEGGKLELRRYALDGEASAPLSTYSSSEASGLIRNRATDLFAVLGREVEVHHDDGKVSTPEMVRVIPGIDPQRFVHAQFPAEGASVYCSGVAPDQVVRWSLESNRSEGTWPAPGTHGRLAISRSGRYCIVANHGVQGVFALNTESGERFMPEDINEGAYTSHYAFAPDETGFAYLAGGRAGFRDWSTRSRIKGPALHDGRIASLHGAWDADVYVYAYDESRLCVVRMA